MKSSEMFEKVLDRFAIGAMAWHQSQTDLAREKELALGDFKRGVESRNAEVAELKEEINQLTRDVRDLVDQVGDLASKLSDAKSQSYADGLKAGRESEVTKATVKVMSDAAARTIFAAMRVN